MIKCEEVKERVQRFLVDGVSTRLTKDDGCVIQMPFHDSEGDPISVVVYGIDESVLLSDGGMVAGRLFTLGQHTQDTPAFKLLRSLEKAYDLKLDFDGGRVTTTIPEGDMYSAIMDFSKVIMTMLTATPHIRVEPHRLKPLGQRLKAKVKSQFERVNILDFVEPGYSLPGNTVQSWPVDFHWWLKRNGGLEEHIYVITVDLDVEGALAKAARINTLALDARRHSEDKLRILTDTHGTDSDATVANLLMKTYSEQLKYHVYDFGQESERQAFIGQSVDEIMSEVGKPWRDFWKEQRVLT